MTSKRRRTPQEKKELSLRKDRRNLYGENAKASRKAIPLRKRKAIRAQRRKDEVEVAVAEDAERAHAHLLRPNLRNFRKCPDVELIDKIGHALGWRRRRFRRKITGRLQEGTETQCSEKS